MGFRQAAVLSSVSFFLGVLFICFNIDQKLLFQTLTDHSIADGYQFYTTFYNAPLAVKGLMHAMIGLGVIGLVGKLHEWDESAIFFDGSSLALYVFGIIIYSSVTIGGLRTIVTPAEEDTESDRIEALRVLSAGNTLIILCLVGVLCLQGGQEYAKRLQAKLEAKAQAEASPQATPAEPIGEEKKSQ
ncbi:Shr3 amino acid permease chaperone [Hysterangium stoloniferum]|nr:Shr3 amino acid permease chaperone [Hysterangium stoloniferum]